MALEGADGEGEDLGDGAAPLAGPLLGVEAMLGVAVRDVSSTLGGQDTGALSTKPFWAAIISAVRPAWLTRSMPRPRRLKERTRRSIATSFPTMALYMRAVFPAKQMQC